jgi:hypothetical protein
MNQFIFILQDHRKKSSRALAAADAFQAAYAESGAELRAQAIAGAGTFFRPLRGLHRLLTSPTARAVVYFLSP